MEVKVVFRPVERRKRSKQWTVTPNGEPRGFVHTHALDELWIHTGTACNLACPFCLEGSKPGDDRMQLMRFDDVRPYVDEALTLGVKQFSFTGGEPFINKDIISILDYALNLRPCMVLTNATEPLIKRLHQIELLRNKSNSLHFRVSLDHFNAARHDAGRGKGMFALALKGLYSLHNMGFLLSVASHALPNLSAELVSRNFAKVFRAAGLPEDLQRIEFPEFYVPGVNVVVPQITMGCMTNYLTESSRREFMCAFSRMLVKQAGRTRVYACTLVDDDIDYDLGDSLIESLQKPVSMKHHRCFSCFRFGASCSEMKR